MHERSGNRPEHVQESALQPAANAAELEHRCGEDDHRRLDDDVAVAHVGKLVRQHRFQLGRRRRAHEPGADRER